jgi:hypothetical protein
VGHDFKGAFSNQPSALSQEGFNCGMQVKFPRLIADGWELNADL